MEMGAASVPVSSSPGIHQPCEQWVGGGWLLSAQPGKPAELAHMENLSCEERVGELFSLEEKRLWRDLPAAFQHLKGLQESQKGTLDNGRW